MTLVADRLGGPAHLVETLTMTTSSAITFQFPVSGATVSLMPTVEVWPGCGYVKDSLDVAFPDHPGALRAAVARHYNALMDSTEDGWGISWVGMDRYHAAVTALVEHGAALDLDVSQGVSTAL